MIANKEATYERKVIKIKETKLLSGKEMIEKAK